MSKEGEIKEINDDGTEITMSLAERGHTLFLAKIKFSPELKHHLKKKKKTS